jgi:c-di-GMP-binding flagellar brake protein YcgR
METLEQLLRPGKEVQLEFTGMGGEKIVYQTRIIRSMQVEHLALLMSASEETLYQLSAGTMVTLTCRSESKNVFTFTSEFVEIKPGELPILIVIRPTKIENATRRNFFRCDVKLQFSYYLKNRDFRGEVINLSAGGIFAVIEADSSIIVGTRLACKLFLPKTKLPIMFVGRVVDIRKHESATGLALSFQNLTKDQQSQIVKYLFDQQRVMLVQKRVNSARTVNM